jgi:hypothetical protein
MDFLSSRPAVTTRRGSHHRLRIAGELLVTQNSSHGVDKGGKVGWSLYISQSGLA